MTKYLEESLGNHISKMTNLDDLLESATVLLAEYCDEMNFTGVTVPVEFNYKTGKLKAKISVDFKKPKANKK